jgi:pimeloyl-ACP methyl ester carboxylesterase
MPIEKIQLNLINGKVLQGLKCGTGSIPCVIVGPGSFYLNKLSESFKEQVTFYTFDEEWTYSKGEKINTELINALTFDSLIDQVDNITQALIQKLSCRKIGLIGFSAPGLIAFQAANFLGPDRIAFVIGSGIASSQLDPKFTKANGYFEENADEQRKIKFKQDNENFAALTSSTANGAPLPDSNFVVDAATNHRRLSSNSLYAEFVRSLTAKQIADYANEDMVKGLINDWRFNPVGKMMSEPMRQHFFNDMLSQLSPQIMLAETINTSIPSMLIYGEHDFTTPAPSEADLNQWLTHSNFSFKTYKGSVHYPTWEPASQQTFDKDVLAFFSKYGIHKSSLTENLPPSVENRKLPAFDATPSQS